MTEAVAIIDPSEDFRVMPQKGQKQPLYRKVNIRARGVHHQFGGDYRNERNAKASSRERTRGSMHGRKRRGLDYTPLFRFLLSKVGSEWDRVYKEAVARLGHPDPIFWLVALHENERREVVGMDEASYYNGLYVDEAGILQMVNPDLKPEHMTPNCTCCTHTLNGVRFS